MEEGSPGENWALLKERGGGGGNLKNAGGQKLSETVVNGSKEKSRPDVGGGRRCLHYRDKKGGANLNFKGQKIGREGGATRLGEKNLRKAEVGVSEKKVLKHKKTGT